MTSRERLTGLIHRQPTDRPCWTTLVDDTTRSVMCAGVREMSVLDFYRYIGCDVLQFGNYGLPAELQVTHPYRLVQPDVETITKRQSDGTLVQTLRTPWGNLTSTFRNGHPVKHPVESFEELRILKQMWAACRYEEIEGSEQGCHQLESALADSGIYCHTLGPSPVQQLLQFEMGVGNFYYLLQDYEREFEELLFVMHELRKQEYEICARRLPVEVIIPVENTSSSMISPAVYEHYSLPQLSDYVNIIHGEGQLAILHMCGHLKALLPVIKETGLDGINGLTPPPVGDTRFEDALDVMGEDFIILGGVFQPVVMHAPLATRQDFCSELEKTYTRRIRSAHLLLWIAADGLPTPLERFLWVRDWFEVQ